MPDAVLNGHQHHWEEGGFGDPLIMIYRSDTASKALMPYMSELSKSFRVIIPDLCGLRSRVTFSVPYDYAHTNPTRLREEQHRPATQKAPLMRGLLCVHGGDGGESNSPSKRNQARMYYRHSRRFIWRNDPSPAKYRHALPLILGGPSRR